VCSMIHSESSGNAARMIFSRSTFLARRFIYCCNAKGKREPTAASLGPRFGSSPGSGSGRDNSFLCSVRSRFRASCTASCSSRVAKGLISRFESSRSTSRSESLLPSMRVDEPMLSMVATRRNAKRRSGARVPRAYHAPLNSSSSAMRLKISGVISSVSAPIITPDNSPQLHPFYGHPTKEPDYADFGFIGAPFYIHFI
jgi:hypothetical protein